MKRRITIRMGLAGVLIGLVFVGDYMRDPGRYLASQRRNYNSGGRDEYGRFFSPTKLHELSIALHSHEARQRQLPVAATQSVYAPRVDLHGWETQLLPFLDQHSLYAAIDPQRPWHDRVNLPHFRQPLEVFLNPKVETTANSRGIALAHYSANSRVIVAGRTPLTFAQVTDGLSNTLATGEINARYPPWGAPRNARDPVLGIGLLPTGFGGTQPDGAVFGLLDGKTTYLNSNIDPAVLRALATPDGGEAVSLP